MKFTKIDPNENFDILRYVSENEKWEFGIRRVLFGVRICGNPVGDWCYSFDYCAGDDEVFALALFATIAKILEKYPENVTVKQIQQDFPNYEIKPINRDPYCWKRLQEISKSNICQYCLKSVDGYLEEDEKQWFCPHCGEENLS